MKRNVNVDLFRIIATVFVVLLHVLGQGGILKSASVGSAVYWAAWFLEICAYGAVNCFALISGYVMVDKSTKAKNILGLWFQILFYSLLLTGLFFIFMPETRSKKQFLYAFLPIIGKQWWYVSSYFALFFLIPFLNEAIKHISQQTHKGFLLLVLVGIGFVDCLFPIDAFTLNNGYSAIWLIILYIFGAYIKKYNIHEKITAFKSIIGFFAMIILTFASKLSIHYYGQVKYEKTFISYISVTIVLSSVFLFLFCLNLKLSKPISSLVCFFSPVTLGIYLIHVHPLVFNYIIKDAFASFVSKPLMVMLLYVSGATLLVFILCAAIEHLRILLFNLVRVNKICEFIVYTAESLYQKISRNHSNKVKTS